MSLAHKLIKKIENAYPLYLITILVIIPLLIYFPSLFNSFVWDDEEQILNNAIIQNISNIPYLFASSTFNTGGAGLSGFYYKPLMPVSFSLIFFVWKNNPFGFHLFDLFIHIANGVLVFTFFKRIFSLQKFSCEAGSGFARKYAKTISFFLSLIFLIHPANTESVAYISSTQELLYTFFLLLAVIFTIETLKENKFSIKKLIFINLFMLFSLLSKESGVITIPLIIIFTYLFNRKRLVNIIIFSSFTFGVYLILRFAIAKTPLFQHNSIIPIANASILQRLTTVPFELFSYIRLIFLPKDLFVTQHMVINNITDTRFYLTLPIVLIFLSLIIFLYLKNRSKLYLLFLLWIIFSFSILLNIYALDMTIAERWLYGPMIGVLGLIGVLISYFSIQSRPVWFIRSGIFFLILLISLLSLRTFTRSIDWKNNFTLFSGDEKYSSDSFDLQNNLGVAYFRNGNLKEAKKHFEKSIELSPNWWTAHNNLGVIYQNEKKYEEAKKLYETSIKNGNYYLAYENLAKIRYGTENPKNLLPFIETALSHLPYNETLNKIAALAYYQSGASESAKLYAQRTFLINKTQENYNLLQMVTNGNLKIK